MFSIPKKVIVSLLIFAIIIGILAVFRGDFIPNTVTLGGKQFSVGVAKTPSEREQGLSGRKSLPQDSGLLFIFDKPDKYGFWMKDMNFPIDIIWISEENKIVNLEKSLTPGTYPKVYYPNTSAKYVLEISAGQAEILNLKIGDNVEFLKK